MNTQQPDLMFPNHRCRSSKTIRATSRTWARWHLLVALALLVPAVARANPVMIDGMSLLAFGIVVFWAFVVEAGVVALLLTFRGLAPLRIFLAFLLANGLVFFFLFQPVLRREWMPLPLLELAVVLIDGVVIKLLTSLESLQGDGYVCVGWARAVVISGIGNALSYFVGVIAAHKPWEFH
jgi:hypothetical protein